MIKRLSTDKYFMDIAAVEASRSTCIRRKVGAVLVDYDNHILSTGYNGLPVGYSNCCDTGICKRANAAVGGSDDACLVVHAEQNALLQCKNIDKIKAIYCTTFPCVHCIKLLMNTACEVIIYNSCYARTAELSKLWLMGGNRKIIKIDG